MGTRTGSLPRPLPPTGEAMRQPGRKRLSWGYVLLGFVAITLFIAWALLPELTAPQLARFIAPLGFGIVGIFVVVAIFTVVLLPFLDRLVAPLVERLGPTVAETPPPVSASARTPAARPLTDAERQSLFTAYCEALRDGFG